MTYPSDITRAQFNAIAPLLERARKKTKPKTLDMYEVFNGLLYVVTTGCQWRALPKDYPKWRSVHRYFQLWSDIPEGDTESILARVLKKVSRGRAYARWQKRLRAHGYR